MDDERLKLSETKRSDFTPHITPPQDRKKLFYWDGITYFGTCTVDERRCYFLWLEDLVEVIEDWEKYQVKLNDGTERIVVYRSLDGVHVYGAYVMTQEQCDYIDSGKRTSETDIFKRIRFQECVGYWFVDGLEISEDNFFHGTIEQMERLTIGQRDFINSIPFS